MADKIKEKVAVVGLGPVGLILCVHLQKAGYDVIPCDTDKAKVNLIRNAGIRLEGEMDIESRFKTVCSGFEQLEEHHPGIIIFALKTYQLQSMSVQIADFVNQSNDAPFFICAQNGIDSEEILTEVVTPGRVLRLVINFAGNMTAQNVVKVTFFNPPNYLASVDDSEVDLAGSLAEALTGVGLETRAVDSYELLRRAWEKTILNASLSPICAMGKLTISEAMAMPNTLEIIEQIIEEAVEVAAAEKIRFEDDFVRKCLRYLRKAGKHFPSLAVDLINNRPTEIDYMNGKIVEYGRKHYLRTSLNLAFTNMVKAMMQKNLIRFQAGNGISKPAYRKPKVIRGDCFLGVDLGSAFTKITVLDEEKNVLYRTVLNTHNRERIALSHVVAEIHNDYPVKYSCATGYGRKNFLSADMAKTEINCAAMGVAQFFPGAKNIIDIGGEDIKVIRCDAQDQVESFYMNDKCAAGTGSFLSEIAERAGVEISDMSELASRSNQDKELNSFCTVFAKTEIMKWIFDGKSLEDISRGIYHSIANRVSKLRIDKNLPTFLIGGVIAHHPFLKTMLHEKIAGDIQILASPQFVVSTGAALMARDYYLNNKEQIRKEEKMAS